MGLRKSKAPLLTLPALVPNATIIPITSATPTTSWVTVTPEMAMKWLDDSNQNNRKVREDHVFRLSSDMLSGKWQGRNGEAIRFDANGRLADGQHRLWACITANTPFETLLVTGIDPNSYSTIGIGAKKSFGDFLGPIHGEKNVYLYAATVRLVCLWSRGKLASSDGKIKNPPLSELEVTYRDHPNIRESVNRISCMVETRKLLTASFASLIHYAATLDNNHARVESFMERLGNGLGLTESDPVYQLRRFLLAQRAPRPGIRRAGQLYVLALAIKAWNASKDERSLKVLKFGVEENFPQL